MTVAANREVPPNGKRVPPLEAVEHDLSSVDRELWDTIPEGLGLVSEASRAILRSGGKRLRPALVMMACRAFSAVSERAVGVATAIEMIHGASLLHDDVVDHTQIRRGKSTVGALWSNKVAVMMGDYLFSRSLLEMSRDRTLPLMSLVAEATGRMVLGQIREIEEQNNFHITVDDYLFIIREKTAALMSSCCRLGALLGQAGPAAVESMTEYGLQLGMAFQIVDDCLDFWGDESVLGKPVGSDLGERKFTLPFLYTLRVAEPQQREQISALLQDTQQKLGRRSFRKILGIMDQVNARSYAMNVAIGYGERARRALQEAHPPHGAADLEQLIDYVLERNG